MPISLEFGSVVYLIVHFIVDDSVGELGGTIPVEDPEGCVHVGEAEVEGGGGQDSVPLQHAGGQLRHERQAPEILEVDVSHFSRTQLLKEVFSSFIFGYFSYTLR